MSQTVVIGGVSYVIPDAGERSWGQNVTDLLAGVASRLSSAGVGGVDVQAISTSPVSVVSGKTYLVDTTSNRTLTLPAPTANAFFSVRDITGRAWTNPITIQRAGSESIDSVAGNKTLTIPNGAWLFVCDGSNWFSVRDDDGYVSGQIDGWIPVHGLTPTVSLSGQDGIVTFSGKDMTRYFTGGTRVRLVQSGVTKYFFCKGSTFSTDTTVYLLSPSANTLGSGAITDGSVYASRDEYPYGFPNYFDWTPTLSGVSSTAVALMSYWISGPMITVMFILEGISNSTSFSCNSPVTFTTDGAYWRNAAANAKNNSVHIYSAFSRASSLARTIAFHPDSGLSWAASGEKAVQGTLSAPYAG